MADISESYHYARRSSGPGLGGVGVAHGVGAAYPPSLGRAQTSGQCNWAGWGHGGGRFGELQRAGGAMSHAVVFDDNKIISEQHYHHGDHHHHHHQRHLHHFHDLHLIQEATETMDLRNTPQVCTRVIPSETGAMEMRLRPDLIGRNVFDNGANQYGFGVQYRLDDGPLAGPTAGAAAAGLASSSAGSYGGYVSQYGGYGGAALGRAAVEEELYHHRRTSM